MRSLAAGRRLLLPAEAPSVYLYDTFTGSNGVLLIDHAPDVGGPWVTDGSSNMSIQGNRLFAAGLSFALVSAAESFSATATVEAADATTIAFRFWHIDANNYWLSLVASATGLTRIQRFVANVGTTMASTSGSAIGTGVPFPVSLTVDGDSIVWTANGVTASHTAVGAAKSALVGPRAPAAYFDDMTIGPPA